MLFAPERRFTMPKVTLLRPEKVPNCLLMCSDLAAQPVDLTFSNQLIVRFRRRFKCVNFTNALDRGH